MSSMTVEKELAALEKMTTGDLQAKSRELFGDEARSWNRRWLFRRCAWRPRTSNPRPSFEAGL